MPGSCTTGPKNLLSPGRLTSVAAWRDGPPVDDLSLVLVEVR
jgi:hypothetical protein